MYICAICEKLVFIFFLLMCVCVFARWMEGLKGMENNL
jgi:hypothetical protein